MEKRKDNRGRNLRTGEYQKKDGRYEYKYQNHKGELVSIYSWRLNETDKMPAGKRYTEALRTQEKKINRDLEDGIIVQRDLSLNKFFDEYIQTKTELKQSTRTNYIYTYNRYVRDGIGKMNIAKIKYSTMKKFFNELITEKGFKPNSVEVLNTILHPVFRVAVRDGYIRTNPTDGIISELKKSHDWEATKRHALTEKQQEVFVDYVRNHKTYGHWLPLITCLLGTGCRIGEMLGLTWSDVDYKNNVIHINHSLIYRQQDDGTCKFCITTTKTKNSVRDIPMFPEVRKALNEARKYQFEHGANPDVIDGYSGFIWQSKTGHAQNPMCINRALQRIIRDYNAEEEENARNENREPVLLPHFSAHNLRHTFCTRLCEHETDLKLIQEIMGHADITTTMDIYNESSPERKHASFDRISGMMKIS